MNRFGCCEEDEGRKELNGMDFIGDEVQGSMQSLFLCQDAAVRKV